MSHLKQVSEYISVADYVKWEFQDKCELISKIMYFQGVFVLVCLGCSFLARNFTQDKDHWLVGTLKRTTQNSLEQGFIFSTLYLNATINVIK